MRNKASTRVIYQATMSGSLQNLLLEYLDLDLSTTVEDSLIRRNWVSHWPIQDNLEAEVPLSGLNKTYSCQ